MTKLQAIVRDHGLFAKKGEAVPAGIPVRDPAAPRGSSAGGSALSFLIQRGAPAAKAAAPSIAPPPPAPAAPAWHDDGAGEYVATPRLQPAGGGQPPTADGEDEAEWRRISFRLSADCHRRLRNIARLWGVSNQSLLQRAVASFLDAAVNGDDSSWRH